MLTIGLKISHLLSASLLQSLHQSCYANSHPFGTLTHELVVLGLRLAKLYGENRNTTRCILAVAPGKQAP